MWSSLTLKGDLVIGKLKDRKKGALTHLLLIRDELEQLVEYTKEDDEIDLHFADLSQELRT